MLYSDTFNTLLTLQLEVTVISEIGSAYTGMTA